MVELILPLMLLVGQESLPSIDALEQKREQLRSDREIFVKNNTAIPSLEDELKAAQEAGNEDLIKKKKEELEAAKKERMQAFEGLKDMRKDRREDIKGYRDFKKEIDEQEASDQPVSP